MLNKTRKYYTSLVYYLFLSAFSFFIFSSCEKEEIIFKGPYHVRFTETTASAMESVSKPIQIPIHLVGPQMSEPVTVNYTISGTAREGVDYVIEGNKGTVVIPANQSFGNINLKLINNANNILESQDVIFTITAVSPASLQVGRSKDGIIGRTTTFTILDDCILSGTYIGTVGADVPPVPDITITSTDCEEYTLSNWDINVFGRPRVRSLTFIDNGDNTLTIPIQEDPTLPEELATIEGTGSVNPLNKRITFNIRLVDFEDSPTFTITYIPER